MEIEVDILHSNLHGPCLCLAPRGLTDPLKCEGTDATEVINQKYRKKNHHHLECYCLKHKILKHMAIILICMFRLQGLNLLINVLPTRAKVRYGV